MTAVQPTVLMICSQRSGLFPEGLGQMRKVARLLMRGTILVVGLFVLCFLFALAFLIFVPLALERAMGVDASLPFGVWSQVRLAAIVGNSQSGAPVPSASSRRKEVVVPFATCSQKAKAEA